VKGPLARSWSATSAPSTRSGRRRAWTGAWLPRPGGCGARDRQQVRPLLALPGAATTVTVSQDAKRSKVSVGSNPWARPARAHDISRICERYGGGGHPVVGAVSLDPDRIDEARRVAARSWSRSRRPEAALDPGPGHPGRRRRRRLPGGLCEVLSEAGIRGAGRERRAGAAAHRRRGARRGPPRSQDAGSRRLGVVERMRKDPPRPHPRPHPVGLRIRVGVGAARGQGFIPKSVGWRRSSTGSAASPAAAHASLAQRESRGRPCSSSCCSRTPSSLGRAGLPAWAAFAALAERAAGAHSPGRPESRRGAGRGGRRAAAPRPVAVASGSPACVTSAAAPTTDLRPFRWPGSRWSRSCTSGA